MSLADLFNSDQRTARQWEEADRKNGRPTTKDANARLLRAYKKRGLKMAEQALGAGACADLVMETGKEYGGYGYGVTIYKSSLLVLAAQNGLHEFASLLLKHGAKADFFENKHNWTSLHYAASNGDTPMVRLLLDAGATPSPGGYHSPYQLAREKQYTDIATMIDGEPARREAQKKADYAEGLRRHHEAEARAQEAKRQSILQAAAIATKAPSVTQTGQSIKVMEPLKIKKNGR